MTSQDTVSLDSMYTCKKDVRLPAGDGVIPALMYKFVCTPFCKGW